MGCDTGVTPIKKKPVAKNVADNQVEEKKNMSSSMVRQVMPEFTMDAFDSATGHFKKVSDKDYKGKWTGLFLSC